MSGPRPNFSEGGSTSSSAPACQQALLVQAPENQSEARCEHGGVDPEHMQSHVPQAAASPSP
eukprot:498209-Alexandrium_andersonii.AAC.1